MKNNDLKDKVESANPVRPGAFQNLSETTEGRDLLERIVEVPQQAKAEGGSTPDSRVTEGARRRGPRSFVAGAVAVALILGVVTVVSWPKPDSDTSTAWAASLIKLAKGSPRLLVTADGWEVVRADEVNARRGEMTFSNGERSLDLYWSFAAEHRGNIKNLRREATAEWPMTIAGEQVVLFQKGDPTDFTAAWVAGNRSMLLGGLFPDVDAYRSIAASIRRVDVNSWLSALPTSVVQPYARASSVESMLADIPVHPSVDIKELKSSPNVRERYQLGAEVTSAVSCAWISQWVDATNDGDDAAAREAVDAMTTARDWTVLHEMNDEGDWPEVLWAIADAMVDNSSIPAGRPMTVEEGYRSALGCEGG
jgi:hypothetical protein